VESFSQSGEQKHHAGSRDAGYKITAAGIWRLDAATDGCCSNRAPYNRWQWEAQWNNNAPNRNSTCPGTWNRHQSVRRSSGGPSSGRPSYRGMTDRVGAGIASRGIQRGQCRQSAPASNAVSRPPNAKPHPPDGQESSNGVPPPVACAHHSAPAGRLQITRTGSGSGCGTAGNSTGLHRFSDQSRSQMGRQIFSPDSNSAPCWAPIANPTSHPGNLPDDHLSSAFKTFFLPKHTQLREDRRSGPSSCSGVTSAGIN